MPSDAEKRPLHHSEVAKHADKDSLWVIVNGNVRPPSHFSSTPIGRGVDILSLQAYDLTEFAPEHPGGMGILLKYGGKDATEVRCRSACSASPLTSRAWPPSAGLVRPRSKA
jgi:L-lactate dehydrogenase (cytochrome)